MAAIRKPTLAKLSWPAKFGVGALMLTLPAAGYYIVFHSEIQTEINAAKATNQNLTLDLEAAEKAEHNYQKDLEELRERERRKAELVKILPVTTEYPAFLASVQNVANLVGVELVGWTPQEEVPEAFYTRVPMRIELSGRYHRLAKFFYNVGQIERIINMEDITLQKPELVEGEVLLKVSVLATAFHAADESVQDPASDKASRRNRKP
jgi:type IV pilus assembly protein PilO